MSAVNLAVMLRVVVLNFIVTSKVLLFFRSWHRFNLNYAKILVLKYIISSQVKLYRASIVKPHTTVIYTM
jgi:hypothetical protein